ncbi:MULTISPECIES: tetratricopeptide repeat protein [unclassified Pseudomonas]|uniref:tetratricopeptide repeat protein n=1 Tax=unclassified Pseudomonas TaxID=196821 RepID=UPI000A1F1A50|nr:MULTISPECIES: tetratricopeptide repeat protein [unclassified Pseudomonas]MDI2143404.1 tetratricopeptide repeat protein [Pseudomonas sp. ITA]
MKKSTARRQSHETTLRAYIAGCLTQSGHWTPSISSDSLYFRGDHLYRQKRYAEARAALLKARQAAPRPGRESADAGRYKEIDALLVDVNKKLE